MTTISLTVCDATPRESTLRRIALSAGVALVRWAHRRPLPPTHEQRALRLAAQQAVAQQRDGAARYGFVR
ncbi:hypothetical protein [Microcella humidisoli]|uniref:Uncharacterized protein n=1 Tax=Microcella humidisoli TaxID=2963406 RepID=A0ABY5FUH8_9MICO|nr:hypothetical protein [Microcella humidisoli]UTT61960.1 hypothetical protein NNL39_09800 [Microcella humidisoli]